MGAGGSTFEMIYRTQDPKENTLAQILLRSNLQSIKTIIDKAGLNRLTNG